MIFLFSIDPVVPKRRSSSIAIEGIWLLDSAAHPSRIEELENERNVESIKFEDLQTSEQQQITKMMSFESTHASLTRDIDYHDYLKMSISNSYYQQMAKPKPVETLPKLEKMNDFFDVFSDYFHKVESLSPDPLQYSMDSAKQYIKSIYTNIHNQKQDDILSLAGEDSPKGNTNPMISRIMTDTNNTQTQQLELNQQYGEMSTLGKPLCISVSDKFVAIGYSKGKVCSGSRSYDS